MMRLDKYGLVNDLISVFESYPPMKKFVNTELDVIELKPSEIEGFIHDLGKIFCRLIEENTSIEDENTCSHDHDSEVEEDNDEEEDPI